MIASQEDTKIQALEARIAKLEERSGGPWNAGRGTMLDMDQAIKALSNGGFEGASTIRDPKPQEKIRYRSTVIVCPTRGVIDSRVIDCWNALQHVANERRLGPLFARGFEVGAAYDALISGVLEHPQLKTWKYILTLEEDNLPPPDAHIRLIEALEAHPEYDAVAGLYHTKDPAQVPMAYGDPAEFKRTGRTYHFPISKAHLDPNGGPVEVLGIPMGCTLWRMDLFKRVPPSWFMTLSEKVLVDRDGKPTLVPADTLTNEQTQDAKKSMTQDLLFCEVAVKYHGARFAVHPGVRVGHLDVGEGVIY